MKTLSTTFQTALIILIGVLALSSAAQAAIYDTVNWSTDLATGGSYATTSTIAVVRFLPETEGSASALMQQTSEPVKYSSGINPILQPTAGLTGSGSGSGSSTYQFPLFNGMPWNFRCLKYEIVYALRTTPAPTAFTGRFCVPQLSSEYGGNVYQLSHGDLTWVDALQANGGDLYLVTFLNAPIAGTSDFHLFFGGNVAAWVSSQGSMVFVGKNMGFNNAGVTEGSYLPVYSCNAHSCTTTGGGSTPGGGVVGQMYGTTLPDDSYDTKTSGAESGL